MRMLGTTTKKILKEAFQNALSPIPFRIVGKNIDDLTKRATFYVKTSGVSNPIPLKTHEIIHDDQYFLGLVLDDRKQVKEQYLMEIEQPLAYIAEYPVTANHNNEYIFKILLVEKRKIICGTASHFLQKDHETLSMLNQQDTVRLTIAYYSERFIEQEVIDTHDDLQINVRYLSK